MSTENKSSITVGEDTTEKKPQTPSETFVADGVKYKFITARFILNGKEINAEDALYDDEILAELVDIKSGVIKAVGKVQTEGGE